MYRHSYLEQSCRELFSDMAALLHWMRIQSDLFLRGILVSQSIALRGIPCDFLEHTAEITDTVKTAGDGDIFDARIRRFHQKDFGVMDADTAQVMHDCLSGDALEGGAEIFRCLMKMCGQIIQRKVLSVMVFQIENDFLDEPGTFHGRTHRETMDVTGQIEEQAVEFLGTKIELRLCGRGQLRQHQEVGPEKAGIGERVNSLPVQPETVQDPDTGITAESERVDDPVSAQTLVSMRNVRFQNGNLPRM